jgi:hypothetical protein
MKCCTARPDPTTFFDDGLQNRYSFAGGNPISFVEMDGHDPNAYDYYRRSKQKTRLQRKSREYSAAPDSRPVAFRPETERRASVGERNRTWRPIAARKPKTQEQKIREAETSCKGWGGVDCSVAGGPVRGVRLASRAPRAIARFRRGSESERPESMRLSEQAREWFVRVLLALLLRHDPRCRKELSSGGLEQLGRAMREAPSFGPSNTRQPPASPRATGYPKLM